MPNLLELLIQRAVKNAPKLPKGSPDIPWEPYELGNIDLYNRPHVKNPEGTVSTVRSMSFGTDGKEVLVPTVSDDSRIMSDEEAFQEFVKTGKHLGKFQSPSEATRFAERLHNEYARGKYGK